MDYFILMCHHFVVFYSFLVNQSIPVDREPKIKIIYEPEKVKEWIFILLTALCALGIFVSFVFIPFLIFRSFRLVLNHVEI